MGIIVTLLTIINILIAILIIALVLVQQSKKSGGLGTTFGGGSSDTLFGAHASTHLSRLTVIFATLFVVITLTLAILAGHRQKSQGLMELNSPLTNVPINSKTESKVPLNTNTLPIDQIPSE